jgi:hypothetical protein
MWYAMMAVCLFSAQVCDVEHAKYAEQSAPIYSSEAECNEGVIAHLHELDSKSQLDADTQYQVDVECFLAEPPV